MHLISAHEVLADPAIGHEEVASLLDMLPGLEGDLVILRTAMRRGLAVMPQLRDRLRSRLQLLGRLGGDCLPLATLEELVDTPLVVNSAP